MMDEVQDAIAVAFSFFDAAELAELRRQVQFCEISFITIAVVVASDETIRSELLS